MKQTSIYILIISLLIPGAVLARANCVQSSSWQCQQRQPQTGSGATVGTTQVLPPTTAPTGTTTPPLGSIPPDHHNVVLIPIVVTGTAGPTASGYASGPQMVPTPSVTGARPQPTPNPQAVPAPILPSQKTPPQPIVVNGTAGPTISGYASGPQMVPTPSVTGVRPQPTRNPQAVPAPILQSQKTPPQPIVVTGTAGPTVSGYASGPQMAPSPSLTGARPQPIQHPQAVPTPILMPDKTPHMDYNLKPGMPSHQLVVHQPPAQKPVTSGHHAGLQPYSLEFIEPGIQTHRVEVYRSKDVREVIYRDSHPLDVGDFHLRVIGIRNPEYSH